MVFGALFKLPHWPSMELLGLIAGTLKFVAVTVLVQRVLRYPAFQDFLDK